MNERLTACLDMQSAALAEFTQVLDEEARAMAEGRFKHLPDLIARKTELARQLVDLDREREALQMACGFDPGRAPAPGEHALHQAWQQLLERAAQAREANHRNGAMVHTLMDFTRQALGTLHGGSRPLYGSDGRHPEGTGSRKSLGKG